MTSKFKSIYLILFSFLFLCCGREEKALTRNVSLNNGWYFHLGDVKDASRPEFNDAGWSTVNLPHDWSIEDLPEQKKDVTSGRFSRGSVGGIATGHTVGGVGWYLKTFVVLPKDKDKLRSLYFEGVYMETEVWINGKRVCYHPNGYTSFFCDITPYCLPAGKTNTIAVKVTNAGKNSRWYSGSGIYRPVWMITTDKLHVENWGCAVTTPEITGKKAKIKVSVNVRNQYAIPKQSSVYVRIVSPGGSVVGTGKQKVALKAGEKKEMILSVEIREPQCWSTENPVLYKALAGIRDDSEGAMDEITVPFGIRQLAFSAKNGFLLNGRPLKLRGGCLHHDNGLLGAAAIDRAEERKVELLKANGFNAVRCAHNPPSEKFLDACDKMGLLVIDEAFDQWMKAKNPGDYHRFFEQYGIQDLSSMVLRDRNHPSIILWSIGNEIQERSDSDGIRIAQKLKNTVRQYDQTRPVTAAVNDYWDNPKQNWKADSEKAFSTLDVAGCNYMWYEYENDHNAFPHRIMFGSESVAGETAVNWNLVEKHPYILGDFVWTAMDYLGESGIGHALELAKGESNLQFLDWPWFNAWCGDLDICGDKKPQSFYRDVIWRRRPLAIGVHAPLHTGLCEKVSYWGWTDEYPSWDWNGLEGKILTVRVYSRAPLVRLYLNGKLCGAKAPDSSGYAASFRVNYAPGELKAVNVVHGKETQSLRLSTSGKPAKIRLVPDRTRLKASPADLSFVRIEITDRNGRIVSNSPVRVTLKISGAGMLAGSGNASPTDMESFRSLTPRVYRGKALAIVRPDGTKGCIRLEASAPGFPDAFVRITAH
jgi:beta-galactosidase